VIPARISKRAQRDLAAICSRIAVDNPEASEQVRQALLDTADLLVLNPDAGVRIVNAHPRHRDVRWFVTSKFRNYLIFYKPLQETILVIRILHAKRDWTKFF